MDLFTSFTDLPAAQSPWEFAAVSLSRQRRDFLAKSTDGSPVFLIHDSSSATYVPAIELKSISLQFHATCRVSSSDIKIEDQFAVVACDSSMPELHELFIRCFAAAVEQLPSVAITKDIRHCVQELINLFRALGQPSGRELAGLWAELFVMTKCKDVVRALRAWRENPFERFDFSWPAGCLEVKAATRGQREHEFALEQLQQPLGGAGFVASLLLQPINGGVGVVDLANFIEQSITSEPKLKQKLWGSVIAALGDDFSERLDRRFDPSFAERNLIVYSMSDVPTLQVPNDPRITGVRFRADLSSVKSSLTSQHGNILQTLFS